VERACDHVSPIFVARSFPVNAAGTTLNPEVPGLKIQVAPESAMEQKSSPDMFPHFLSPEFPIKETVMKSLSLEMISALAELDSRIPGLGLYSSFEYETPAGKTHPFWKIEWEMALRPRLEALGCTMDRKPIFGKTKFQPVNPLYTSIHFLMPTAKVCDLRLVRTSTVKVRRYGSGYHVDRTVDFEGRWAQLKMEKQIRELWWPERCRAIADIRMILFLGFDRANRPFHTELTALEKSIRWTEHSIAFQSKSWPDAYGRAFNILAACWSSMESKGHL
jgi:hypothetical protein